MALRTHLLAAARIGSYGTGETTLAGDLDDSLCIVVRGFFTAATLSALPSSGSGRHWLTRTRKRTQLRTIQRLGKDDELVEIVLGGSSSSAEISPDSSCRSVDRHEPFQEP